MALFQYGDKFTVAIANAIRKLWASATAPADPANGEIWLDTSGDPYLLKRYNGAGWDSIGAAGGGASVTVGPDAPEDPNEGDIWVDTDDESTNSIPVKATGAEIDTGADDAKFATPKAILDSGILSGAVSGEIAALTAKTIPADDDVALIEDSEATNAKKKITWSNIKSAIRGALWRDTTSDENANCFIQSGSISAASGGSSVTFDIEFAAAPRVIATVVTTSFYSAIVNSITTTGFTCRAFQDDGVAKAATINWIAIGRKN